MTLQSPKEKKRPLLWLALGLALGAHLLVFAYLTQVTIEFHSSHSGRLQRLFGAPSSQGQENERREQQLEETWKEGVAVISGEYSPVEEDLFTSSFGDFSEEWDLSFDLEDMGSLPSSEDTASLDWSSSQPLFDIPTPSPQLASSPLSLEKTFMDHEKNLSTLLAESDALQKYAGFKGEEPNQKGVLPSSDTFEIKVHQAKRSDGKGVDFRITLTPLKNVSYKTVRNNLYFLIDRSHSISEERYEASQDAVCQALEFLNPGDRFNLLVFDKEVVRFSESLVTWNPQNIVRARAWLKNQEHGGFFATTDLYTSLAKIVPQAVKETEVNTAILLSDGDTFLSQQDQRRSIGFWTRKNAGKVSLYAVTAGEKNNCDLLKFLARMNRGNLVHAPRHRDTSRTLVDLMKQLRHPIGKELVVTLLPHSSKTQVQQFPPNHRLPNLYKNQNLEIVGTMSQPDTLTVFVQGKYYHRWLDVKQEVQLNQATKVDSLVSSQVAQERAYEVYEKFLKSGKSSQLSEARHILAPYKIQPAFQ